MLVRDTECESVWCDWRKGIHHPPKGESCQSCQEMGTTSGCYVEYRNQDCSKHEKLRKSYRRCSPMRHFRSMFYRKKVTDLDLTNARECQKPDVPRQWLLACTNPEVLEEHHRDFPGEFAHKRRGLGEGEGNQDGLEPAALAEEERLEPFDPSIFEGYDPKSGLPPPATMHNLIAQYFSFVTKWPWEKELPPQEMTPEQEAYWEPQSSQRWTSLMESVQPPSLFPSLPSTPSPFPRPPTPSPPPPSPPSTLSQPLFDYYYNGPDYQADLSDRFNRVITLPNTKCRQEVAAGLRWYAWATRHGVDPEEEIADYYGPVCGEPRDDDEVEDWESRAEGNTTPPTQPDDSTTPRRSRNRKRKNRKPKKEA